MSTDFVLDTAIASSGSVAPARMAARGYWPGAFEWMFVITGGAILALPFVLHMGEAGLSSNDTVRWYFWISALISSPHVYSTYVRLQRKISERKVSWWLGFPAYFGSAGLLGVCYFLGCNIEVMTAVNVWQSYHYVRQTYGVGCLYGRQERFEPLDRSLRWWAYHLTFPLLIIGRWDVLYDVWRGQTYTFAPMNFSAGLIQLLWLVAAVGLVTAVLAEARLVWKNGWSYRPVSLLCFVACFAAHAYGFLVASHFQRGFFFITIFHAVQYLALVWVLERRTAIARGWNWMSAIPNFAGFALFWLVLFALGFGYEDYFTVALASYWTKASACLLGAISVHHYLVDSFIWRREAGE